MDQFELARLKNEKRLERIARTQANQVNDEVVVFIEPPKEKADISPDAVVEVNVTLPDKTFSFTLVKPFVYQNAKPSRLTRGGFLNCVLEGLKPLLGGVKEQ